MSTSEIEFVVNADPDVETLVIDHAFRLVHSGAGRFTHRLPAGLYKFKFRRGLAVGEQFVELAAKLQQPVSIKPHSQLLFTSSAPLAKTRGAAGDHLAAAKRMSKQPPIDRGGGGRIFLFVRISPDATNVPANVGEALTLHDADGTLLVDMATDATHDNAGSACAGCHVSVPPGAYRLRHTMPDEALEMTVIVSPGWQTQVFLMRGTRGDAEMEPTPLASASVMMSMGGFEPENELLRLADASLIALRQKRIAMSHDLLNQLLADKFENPMLGIYAAHAMRAAGSDDALLPRVAQTLDHLVRNHPDVNALSLDESHGEAVFSMPPMLRASWAAIVEGSLSGTATLVPGSLASRIPAALLEGTPWLIWAAEELLDPQLTAPRDITADLLAIDAVIAQSPDADAPPTLTAGEEELFTFLSRRRRLDQKREKKTEVDDKSLARALNTTLPHVHATVSGLAAKLH